MLAPGGVAGQGAAVPDVSLIRWPPRRALVLAVTVTMLGASCGGDNRAVRRDLAAQSRANDALRERVEQVEATLRQLHRRTGEQARIGERVGTVEEAARGLHGRMREAEGNLADVGDTLGSARRELEALERRMAAERLARRGDIAELDRRVDRLLSRVATLEPLVNQLRRDLATLRSAHNLLKQRFATHTRHPPG